VTVATATAATGGEAIGLATSEHGVSRALYIPSAGTITVYTAGGDSIEFAGLQAGTVLPIQVKRVDASSVTSTSGIIALW